MYASIHPPLKGNQIYRLLAYDRQERTYLFIQLAERQETYIPSIMPQPVQMLRYEIIKGFIFEANLANLLPASGNKVFLMKWATNKATTICSLPMNWLPTQADQAYVTQPKIGPTHKRQPKPYCYDGRRHDHYHYHYHTGVTHKKNDDFEYHI